MNIQEFKNTELTKHKLNNNILDSFIEDKVLKQCMPLVPERKEVGQDNNGNIIFFEETSGSLQKRHYGLNKEATSFNLLYSDGFYSQKVNQEYLNTTIIKFNKNYDIDILMNFVLYNNHRFNALKNEKRRKYNFFLTEDENQAVMELLEKMRGMKKDENN